LRATQRLLGLLITADQNPEHQNATCWLLFFQLQSLYLALSAAGKFVQCAVCAVLDHSPPHHSLTAVTVTQQLSDTSHTTIHTSHRITSHQIKEEATQYISLTITNRRLSNYSNPCCSFCCCCCCCWWLTYTRRTSFEDTRHQQNFQQDTVIVCSLLLPSLNQSLNQSSHLYSIL
jgi:hypothetical protein